MSGEGVVKNKHRHRGKWYVSITREFSFDAAHRLVGHESKCKYLHGHRYSAFVTVEGPELDGVGRVIDFAEVKRIVGGWIDTNWDHNIILNSEDPLIRMWKAAYGVDAAHRLQDHQIFAGREPYILDDENPTAENIAQELYRRTDLLLPDEIDIIAIRLYETPKNFADFRVESR